MPQYPWVSVVVPTHNRKGNVIELIQSVRNSAYPPDKIEIIVVDDASTDGTYENLQRLFPEIKVIRNITEKLPSASRNAGLKSTRGDFIFLIDDDNVITATSINELIRVFLSNGDVGLAGPIALYGSRREKIWCAGGQIRPPLFIHRHLLQYRNIEDLPATARKATIEVDYIPNAFMVRREIVDRGGLFDERLPIGWEEIDLAIRIREMGYKTVLCTSALIFHDVPFSQEVHINKTRAFWRGRDRVVFYRKHLPLRCLLIPFDVLGFLALVVRLKVQLENVWEYIRGTREGITTKVSR